MDLWTICRLFLLILISTFFPGIIGGRGGGGWNRGGGGGGGWNRGGGGGYRHGGGNGGYGNNYHQGNPGHNWNGGGGGYPNSYNNYDQYQNTGIGNSNEHGHWNNNQEQQTEIGCAYPDETELGGVFEIEGCSKSSGNWQECNAMKRIVPVGKMGQLMCMRAKKILKFTTVCQNNGNWSPKIPSSCIELFEMSEAKKNTPNKSNWNWDNQNQNYDSTTALQPTVMLNNKNNEKTCSKPKIRFQSNEEMKYEVLCSKGNQVVQNCIQATSVKELQNESKIIVKCKAPFVGLTSNSASLECNNGRWIGGSMFKDFQCELPQIDEKNDNQEYPSVNTGGNSEVPVQQLRPIFPPISPSSRPVEEPIFPHVIPVAPPTSKSKEIYCTPIQRTIGMKLECVYSKDDTTITNKCDQPKILPGTEARLSCDEYYEPSVGIRSVFRKCKEDGTWSAESTTFQCIVECGKENIIKKAFISHSLPTLRGQFPWHGGIYYDKGNETWVNACGGTLISRKAFVTASHCVTKFQESQAISEDSIRVHLGQYNRSLHDSLVQIKAIKKIIINKNYNPYTFESDIAILIFENEVNIGYYARPICFPQTMDSALEDVMLKENSTGTVVGWGLNEFKKYSEELRMTRLRVAGIGECSDKLVVSSQSLRSTIFCATARNSSVCEGDSGGGMYFPTKEGKDESNRWYIQGLVSFGIANNDGSGICDPSQFSAFTRVGRYADFISRTLSEYDAL